MLCRDAACRVSPRRNEATSQRAACLVKPQSSIARKQLAAIAVTEIAKEVRFPFTVGKYPTIPPRVEYELTELGRTLRKPIQSLAK